MIPPPPDAIPIFPDSPAMSRLRILTAVLLLPSSLLPAAEVPTYNRDIRPILFDNCFTCHGPDSASRKAGLRLDRFGDATRRNADGRAAIVPGDPEASELLARIVAADPDDRMPPPETHKEVTPVQVETLRRWIEAGANYERHWSFIAPVRPSLPAVANPAWARNPVDHFILAELEKAGLEPAPEADRHTLARRVSLDLTGLPPSPEMVEAFVSDPSPDAYERYVDRLLAMPEYGEHRARYWLDYARYADTHGIHFDNYREIWPYREAVIHAFNRNQPFDEFTVEQLAGDLLPGRTLDQLIASGFNRCNITTNEGGAIDEEYLVLYARDRTETTSQVWMGLTTGCAVCHDHKFDPVSQKEFYSLSAYFNNTTQAAMDGNVSDTPPVVPVPPMADRARWDALPDEIAAARAAVDARRAEAQEEFAVWAAAAGPETFRSDDSDTGLALRIPLRESEGNQIAVLRGETAESAEAPAGAGAVDGPRGGKALLVSEGTTVRISDPEEFEYNTPLSISLWIRPGRDGLTGSAIARMDESKDYRGWDVWLEGGRPSIHLIHAWDRDALKVVAKTPLSADKWQHVLITYDGSSRAAGVRIFVDGAAVPVAIANDRLKSTIRADVPLSLGQRHRSARLEGIALHDVRLYHRALPDREGMLLARFSGLREIAAKPAAARSPGEQALLFDWWFGSVDPKARGLTEALQALEQEQAAIRSRSAVTHVMQEKDGEPVAWVLARGEYDQRREAVSPDTPAILPPMPPDFPRNRLGLARWLLLPEHPLTARVTVNRFWQEVFGTGLVTTSGDFGISGELPSHPELLDWLAVEFRENGWNVKALLRLLVTSATYRQAATVTPEKLAADPDNRLLSRGPRFRLDGEMVRDYALAASGLLVQRIGGPSVRPYQPDGVWEAVAMPGSNTRDYRRDSGESLYRRSLYTFWKRSAPPASMEVFNAPSREVCTVRRERTNTPLQALVTLNDIQFVEAARVLATRVLKECQGDAASRLDRMARRVLCRPLSGRETEVLLEALTDLSRFYDGHPDEARDLAGFGEAATGADLPVPAVAAWTMVANQLLNLDEVLNK